MLINQSNISEVFRNLRATFNQALEATPTQWANYATLLDTAAIVEKMDWIGELPNWREWLGDKHVQAMAAHTYNLELVPWEATIGVKRRDLEADRLGIYRQKATSFGELAAYFAEERVADALNGAFTATCWDGKAFFATDHPVETKDGAASTFTNTGTAALSASTQAAAIASLGAGLTALQTMKNSRGRSIRVRGVRLVVPPALRDVAAVLAMNERLEDGKANPYKGLTYDVWPELTSSTAWFLTGESGGLKPIVLVQRKAPTTSQVTDLSDSHVFKTGEFLFGIEADAAAGYTFPQLAYGSTGLGS
jgi:phage major head subunit gpT-like protein